MFLFALSGCQHQNTASPGGNTAPTESAAREQTSEQLVGDWVSQDLGSPLVEENRMILTAILSKRNPDVTVGRLRGVWSQVVAGYNVRMMADYTQGGKSGVLTAIIFHDLEGNAFLKSVEF